MQPRPEQLIIIEDAVMRKGKLCSGLTAERVVIVIMLLAALSSQYQVRSSHFLLSFYFLIDVDAAFLEIPDQLRLGYRCHKIRP